jgi:hypothetical protein
VRKSVDVKAVQYRGDNIHEILDFMVELLGGSNQLMEGHWSIQFDDDCLEVSINGFGQTEVQKNSWIVYSDELGRLDSYTPGAFVDKYYPKPLGVSNTLQGEEEDDFDDGNPFK